VLQGGSFDESDEPDEPGSQFPSNFLRFGHLKGVFQKSSFDESDELLSASQEVLKGADHQTLDDVFQEWMIRLQNCIDGTGEYVELCLN